MATFSYANAVKRTPTIDSPNISSRPKILDDGLQSLYLRGKPWQCLPYNILVHICQLLTEKDRWTMSAVCQSWRDAALNPALWREKNFYLFSATEANNGTRWLRAHDRHLKHVTVTCFGNFDAPRNTFLRCLRHTSLLDLDIDSAAYWWPYANHFRGWKSAMAGVVRLIKTQRQLVGFQMRQARLDADNGLSILDTLASVSGSTITRLGLEDFFSDEIHVVEELPTRLTTSIAQFTSLQALTVNMDYVTDDLIIWLASTKRAVTLNLVSWLSHDVTSPVKAASWTALKGACPNCQVTFTLQNIRDMRRVMRSLLLPQVPMTRLDLIGLAALEEEDTTTLITLLTHVKAVYSRTLTSFKLLCDNLIRDDLEDAMMELVCGCPQLTALDVHMDVRATVLGRLCEAMRSRKAKLTNLRLTRSLTHFQEFDEFRYELETWYPLLKTLCEDFYVRAESAPSHSAWHEYVYIVADKSGLLDSEEEADPGVMTRLQRRKVMQGRK